MFARMRFFHWGICALIALTVSGPGVLVKPVQAQETEKFEFRGVEVTRHIQDYIVLADVNVRDKPKTKSKKVGKLKKLQRIQAVGKAEGAWVAIRLDETDIGFVYEPVLIGVLDGALTGPIDGAVTKDGHPNCTYTILYQGKSDAEGQVFQIADYEIEWRCEEKGKVNEFGTPMFMTEGPYKKSKNPVYQITVDIVDAEGTLDEVVSTTVFYDFKAGTISFDGVSVKRFAGKPEVLTVFARDLPSALRASVEMSYETWAAPLWKVLMRL
jgi:hypothetical protein